ncbi:MAG: hypothetical protein ACD_60C00013G0016 [uncultured bacterium]|nr:MAG: hypothetical protein ACD_60C00013G0016 [uncultured bacterium]
MFTGIDLSSDTATRPSIAMKTAMMNALLGDEQRSEDPTTLQLEKLVADMFGFECALFLPSATMANEIAITTLCNPGEVLLASESCHLFLAECGGPAVHARVLCRPIPTETGIFTPDDIAHYNYWLKGYHHPKLKLIGIENTTNFGGGIPWSKHELNAVVEYAKKMDIHLHLDGSRIFNASTRTKLSVKEICTGFDMVTVCLSKGLGCPTGALLIVNKKHYSTVRHLKHLMGGAMRQSGILAAAGIYALENNISRLQEDHLNAASFAEKLSQFNSHIKVVNQSPETNIVLFDWISNQISLDEFNNQCLKNKVRFSQIGKNRFRAVTHLDVTRDDILTAIKVIKSFL